MFYIIKSLSYFFKGSKYQNYIAEHDKYFNNEKGAPWLADWFDIGVANQMHGFESHLAYGCLSLG